MQRQLNEARRQARPARPSAAPRARRLDHRPGLGAATPPQEHAVWKTLFERQTKLLPGRACDEFVQGMRELPIGAEQIPDFRRLSDVLMQRTGWQVVAVPGLVPDEVFFEHLANRRFPSGHFIRKPHELDYLEEPDVFHDVFGHVPMLMNPVIADYIQAYGEGGLRAQTPGHADTAGARVLVHGRVRPGAAARRAAHLRRGHRLVGHRERVRARRRLAEPHRASTSNA